MIRIFSKLRLLVLLVAPLCFVEVKAQQTGPVVKTAQGFIKGVSEDNIAVFKGVPYAAAPIGKLRYMPPVVHNAWNDTLNAQQFGSIAAQADGKKVNGTEDCLSLNIYTPKTDNHKRAVLVWVHGGSMTAGAGKGENGHAFADKDDIVTVTINYRLGVLGFLYLGDLDKKYATSGNNGVLDCIMALQWIKQNIASFGGDPGRVTLMGESAGAKLISAVLVAPQSKGLFQQYIAESGSVQCIRDTITAKNERIKVMQQLGLKANDLNALLSLPADTLIKAQAKVCSGIGGNSYFGPVYDGLTFKEDAYTYAAGKNLPPIKALIGTNKYEAALFVSREAWLNQPEENILKPLFRDNYSYVYQTYLGELKKNSDPYDAAIPVLTQYMYQMHSYRFADVLAKNRIPVYMYRFDFSNGAQYGARHAAELQYVWKKPGVIDPDAQKEKLGMAIHSAWVAFIKTGNPNTSALPTWLNYTTNTRNVMIFDTVNKVTPVTDVFNDQHFPSSVFVMKKL